MSVEGAFRASALVYVFMPKSFREDDDE